MITKGVKPRTQFSIDALLFGQLALVAFSALMEHAIPGGHVRFMWHVIHGITGIVMCVTLAVHLLVHLPWIRSQLSRLFKNGRPPALKPPQ